MKVGHFIIFIIIIFFCFLFVCLTRDVNESGSFSYFSYLLLFFAFCFFSFVLVCLFVCLFDT